MLFALKTLPAIVSPDILKRGITVSNYKRTAKHFTVVKGVIVEQLHYVERHLLVKDKLLESNRNNERLRRK